jgi:hypothetical protein
MFRNRQLHVEMVKKPKNENTEPDEKSIDLEGKTAIISHAVERSIVKIGVAVCAYVVIDTARKVLIEVAKK